MSAGRFRRETAPIRGWIGALWAAVALLATPLAAQTITDARYDGPTTRYPHGVLGDEVEYTTLTVTLDDGRSLAARYEATLVFEDIAPRLADVTGDGAPEVITVESHEREGARLVVWGLTDGRLRHIARTPFIGTRFRWLAPVGAADLDGDGAIEIAYVDRPHLAKTLRVWRYRDGALREVASLPGLTNHRIGWDYITGGLRDCGQGAEMILASGDWSRLVAARLTVGGIETRDLGGWSRDAERDALQCR